MIKAPALEELMTHGSEHNFNPESFENFLKACPQLNILVVDLALFGRISSAFPFKLKLIYSPCKSFTLNENIKNFMLSQAASVESLDVKSDDSEFHEIVFSKFTQLKLFHSSMDKLTASADFYRSLKPLPFLEDIKCNRGFSSVNALRAVLGNCPEVHTITCRECNDLLNHLDFIAEHNKKLEILTITTIGATNAIFPCLNNLKLMEVVNADNLVGFLRNNPTIKRLGMRWLDGHHLEGDLLGFLMNETNLKRVIITCDAFTIQQVYEAIKCEFGGWKTLQLNIMDGDRKMKIFYFQFPADSADWKPCDNLFDNKCIYMGVDIISSSLEPSRAGLCSWLLSFICYRFNGNPI